MISTAAVTALAPALLPATIYAQDAVATTAEGAGALYRVMWVILAAWAGIAIYIAVIDRKVSRLERERRDG